MKKMAIESVARLIQREFIETTESRRLRVTDFLRRVMLE